MRRRSYDIEEKNVGDTDKCARVLHWGLASPIVPRDWSVEGLHRDAPGHMGLHSRLKTSSHLTGQCFLRTILRLKCHREFNFLACGPI